VNARRQIHPILDIMARTTHDIFRPVLSMSKPRRGDAGADTR